jgi:hypothetical protein
MPIIPPIWRKWIYGVGAAFVPLAEIYGWVNSNQGASILGVFYAIFMGGLAAANTNVPARAGTEVEEAFE